MRKRIFSIVVVVLMAGMALLSSGCQGSITAKGAAFYPEENNGEVHKSRSASAGSTWSWGLGE